MSPEQALLLILSLASIFAVTVIWVASIFASERRKTRLGVLEAEARDDMIKRGFSADEIAKVLAASARHWTGPASRYDQLGPAPCDVAVLNSDGEWARALLLDEANGAVWVHYVGHEMSANAWVPKDRVRFPASIAHGHSADLTKTQRFAQEVSIEVDGEWLPGYVLMRHGQCFVCFVEQDWDECDWVDESRLRYPSTSKDNADVARFQEAFQ